VINTYEFFAGELDLQSIMLANCSNAHIGPETYGEMCLENDIRIVNETRHLFSKDRFVFLHHCDAPADKFLDLYRNIPCVSGMDAGYPTDIRRMKDMFPDVNVCAFINPMAVQQLPIGRLKARVLEAINAGADGLSLANLDSMTGLDRIQAVFVSIAQSCKETGRTPVFSIPPFAADEEEWAFPMYQGTRTNHCTDDWRLLIPKA